jgi:hypothetical protein
MNLRSKNRTFSFADDGGGDDEAGISSFLL